MTAMERFEATPLAAKIIAGLLALLIAIGTASFASISRKLDNSLEKMDSYGDTLSVHRMQIQGLYELRVDVKEIKADLKALSKEVTNN